MGKYPLSSDKQMPLDQPAPCTRGLATFAEVVSVTNNPSSHGRSRPRCFLP